MALGAPFCGGSKEWIGRSRLRMLRFPPDAATSRYWAYQRTKIADMKLLGFLLLLAGWGIVLAALALLAKDVARGAFVVAGVGVEVTGLVLVFLAHPVPRGFEE
jgi:hypothetical protein